MNPFDLPSNHPASSEANNDTASSEAGNHPASTEASNDPLLSDPVASGASAPAWRPRRVAVAAASLAAVAAGGFGVSRLAAADGGAALASPEPPAPPASTVPEDDPTPPSSPAPDPVPEPELHEHGRVVIDFGDGEPIEIAFDSGLIECLDGALPLAFPDWAEFGDAAELGDLGELGELAAIGDIAWGHAHIDQLDGDRLDHADGFPGGSHVMVIGPDGPTFVDLGEGDATVTITQRDGRVDVATTGSAEATDGFPPIMGSADGPFTVEVPDFEVGEFADLRAAIETCIDEHVGDASEASSSSATEE